MAQVITMSYAEGRQVRATWMRHARPFRATEWTNKNVNTCNFIRRMSICGTMTETNATTYQYNQIEAALVAAFNLAPEDI
ncbi:MAG: hypothetical protein O7C66_02635, partial [Alphaproteobacteria bacterium]|nr:hypothetical protein [Alphaproteobacteria bacterium]